MLDRVLEPEVMDTPDDAADYDAMDHSAVNRKFAADFLSTWANRNGMVLDIGTGTAQIPIEICRRATGFTMYAADASREMLKIAVENIVQSGFGDRIFDDLIDAKRLPHDDAKLDAVISNSLIHHVPEPTAVFAEMARVCKPGGQLFVRDLFRPDSDAELRNLVDTYAAGANDHQRALFAASLHAALTVTEVQELVGRLGFPADAVRATSDRHWTFAARR